jgi:uncharacterized protein
MKTIPKLSLILLGLALIILLIFSQNPNSPSTDYYAAGKIILSDKEISIDIADSPDKRMKGLSGRPDINDDQGMLFVFDKADRHVFWMKDMLFPIDIIWLKDGKIVDIKHNASIPVPGAELELYSPKTEADMVLELKAGWALNNGLKEGDVVLFNQSQ